jgi:hypothetical protein
MYTHDAVRALLHSVGSCGLFVPVEELAALRTVSA